MTSESAMYQKVRDFIVKHWGAASAMTRHDSGPHARGEGISLVRGGLRIRPDVYGIVVSNFVEIPILGEGKQRMGGHDGTHAVAQALTYRNLGMLSFVFFPESEFSSDAAPMIKTLCAQAGIALLMVPGGRAPIDPDRHVTVALAGGEPRAVAEAIEHTLDAVKGLGQGRLADVYPHSLRDLLSLFDSATIAKKTLEQRYFRVWRRFAFVLSRRPYDPMVGRKASKGTDKVKREYLWKFVNGLLALGLIAPTASGFRTTGLGEHLRFASHNTCFAPELDPYSRRLFAFAVMKEFERFVLPAVEHLRRTGAPVSSRDYCARRACGESNWRLRWTTERGALRCPSCGHAAVVPGFHRRRDAVGMSYALLKFARAVGIVESRTPSKWADAFPQLRTTTPSGERISWRFYWLGPALLGTERTLDTGADEGGR